MISLFLHTLPSLQLQARILRFQRIAKCETRGSRYCETPSYGMPCCVPRSPCRTYLVHCSALSRTKKTIFRPTLCSRLLSNPSSSPREQLDHASRLARYVDSLRH
ncbi:histone H3 [Fusarium oxysporum f. sp. albedinis]|nr:histone H3 [Fusarium oxysporum f. sp. albedinis]